MTFPTTKLPLVSIIVVNYNYGRFLDDAVRSAFGQSYAEIECIVVDNASTDESPDVIEALERSYPHLIVIRRARNDGQTPASLDGFERSSGEYVIFLDADDYLLPQCVETHVFVHLSMRAHIGMSSGDMLQVHGNRVVVSTGEESSRYIRNYKAKKNRDLMRPYSATDAWPSNAVRLNIERKVYFIPPLKRGWFWSPTSGLCFRRDALTLFADNAKLATLRTGTDLYFAFGTSGLSGSVIIDEPVFAYRVHGGNIFTARAQLDRTLNFTVGGNGDSNIKAQLFLLDHLVQKAQRFATNVALKANLVAFLHRFDHNDPQPGLPRWAARSRAAQAIVRDFENFAQCVGHRPARLFLIQKSRSLRSPEKLLASLPPEAQ
jgi:glycosyltransferase involved in cell wall biosynthesis